MRITNIRNIQSFFDAVLKCKGSVELVTTEGDNLNLKSTLCQYLAITQLFDDAQLEIDLVLSEPDDLKLLEEYIIS